MRNKPLLGIVAALVALGLVGTVGYVFFWDPRPSFDRPAPNDAAQRVTPEQLQQVAGQRIFFGHMSVGKNIISGLGELSSAHDLQAPRFVETGIGEQPHLEAGGAFVHTLIGENRHPYRKLENFDAMLRAGLASEVDVALIKFCYIDIRWDSDVDKLFSAYTETMDALESDYPGVRFVHTTAPLTTGPYGIKDHIKQWVGRNDNAARERYNALVRQRYGSGDLLDVAAVEATAPDGGRTQQLYDGYSKDGAHLNATGSALVAAELVALLNRPRG